MKYILIFLLLSISIAAMAQTQTSSHIRTRTSDDEKTLSIQIDGIKGGRKIQYSKVFDVTGMNKLQKEWLRYRAFDSQNLTVPLWEMPWLITASGSFLAFIIALIL